MIGASSFRLVPTREALVPFEGACFLGAWHSQRSVGRPISATSGSFPRWRAGPFYSLQHTRDVPLSGTTTRAHLAWREESVGEEGIWSESDGASQGGEREQGELQRRGERLSGSGAGPATEEHLSPGVFSAGAEMIKTEADAETSLTLHLGGELLGVFKYVEKLKRAKVQELADRLGQLALACAVLTLVRGVAVPLAEVYKTTPPKWVKLLLAVTAIDSAAVALLALRARRPLQQMAGVLLESESDAMTALERQEEVMVGVATGLSGLVAKLRNVAILLAFSQLTQLLYTVWHLFDQETVSAALGVLKALLVGPWL
eukprot:TRINITY_DN19848_c2_g1_i1.p1 TRINITY_DN19848_c2_g1~~TRINITY_DN19848_c2_g1_i1.p1  ORF type:complete len:316 (+),score=71.29 TRINITY_DN19848_c2_g1_i1:239-1186(+)